MKVEHHYGGPQHADEYGGQRIFTDDQIPYQSPLHDLNTSYMNSPRFHHESIYSRPAATSQTSNFPSYPLVVPQWPSQLTNPSLPSLNPPSFQHLSNSSAPAPTPRRILPLTTLVDNIPTPLSAPAAPTPIPIPQSGRPTLTDQDRRRICKYHEENPSAKQTEIGTVFGVEQSTVSKVLKLKEKYLHLDDGSRTPIKRSKGKIPDIERAVSNWAKKHQRQVLPLSNESIRDKAWMFATTVGSSDCVVKVNNPNRLEKFKQKNGLQGASLPDSSENEDLDMIQPFDPVSGDQAPNAISLMLPAGDRSASAENDVLKDAKGNNHKDFSFQGIHSESNDYFGSYFIDGNITPTFPPAIRSPSLRSQPLRLSKPAPADARPRYITPPTSATAEPVPNAQLFQHSMTFPTLSSQDRTLNIDSEVPYYKHNSISPSIMAPPPNPSSVPPPYSSPSKDEARRALEVVMAFFQSQPVPMDRKDLITMVKIMGKL